MAWEQLLFAATFRHQVLAAVPHISLWQARAALPGSCALYVVRQSSLVRHQHTGTAGRRLAMHAPQICLDQPFALVRACADQLLLSTCCIEASTFSEKQNSGRMAFRQKEPAVWTLEDVQDFLQDLGLGHVAPAFKVRNPAPCLLH